MSGRISVSIGVMAHNEGENISAILHSLLHQKLSRVYISEIIVVSSGSTDATNEVVENYSKSDPRIRLLIQEKRCGKASAINLFLRNSCEEILVVESGDTVPAPNTIEQLVLPFFNDNVGMTGGRPSPLNEPNTFMGFCAHFMWRYHHLRNLLHPNSPKLGELVAFRRVFESIYRCSAVDEAEIEHLIAAKNFRRVYCPEALVHNHGPLTFKELLMQRSRIHLGHLDLKRRTGYSPLVGSRFKILVWGLEKGGVHPRKLSKLFALAGAELLSLSYARCRFCLNPSAPYLWPMVSRGKGLTQVPQSTMIHQTDSRMRVNQ